MTDLRFLLNSADLGQVETLQNEIWRGSETDIVPAHLLRAAVNHGGVVIGVFDKDRLVGFTFGFPGINSDRESSDEDRLIHVSHITGIHPDYRNRGLGFTLKRAQWLFVRQQKIDRICWTYDPLLSRNANLNISKLGTVCNTYIEDYYGEMRSDLNFGLPSDRFSVDWWVNADRVHKRMNCDRAEKSSLDHFLDGKEKIINPVCQWDGKFPVPPGDIAEIAEQNSPVYIVEIPTDFQNMRAEKLELALKWRFHSRKIFQALFSIGYFVTDFVYESGQPARGLYVLNQSEDSY